jgi:hypothetical protein
MRLAILVAFAALASAAHAQTACAPGDLDHPDCDPVAAEPAFEAGPAAPYACNFAQRLTLGPQACQARNVAEAHRRVGELMHDGRCDAAVKAARATGDTDYASRIQAYCADRASSPSGAPSGRKLSPQP